MFKHSLICSTRRIIAPHISRPNTHLLDTFYRWNKEINVVLKRFVQFIHNLNHIWIINPHISHKLSDIRIVLLFNTGVAIFHVWTGSRHLNVPYGFSEYPCSWNTEVLLFRPHASMPSRESTVIYSRIIGWSRSAQTGSPL